MAEENRRLQDENQRLKSKKPFPWRLVLNRAIAVAIGIGAGCLLRWAISGVVKWATTPPRENCYFTAHSEYHNKPWDKWYVWESDCHWFCTNNAVSKDGDAVGFDSQDAAWSFLQAWHMETCK